MENVPVDGNCNDVKMSRLVFAEWLLQNEQEIISIDESGFHLWLSRSRGRPSQGQRALRIVGARKGPHFNFILAVSNQCGVIYHMIHNGGTNIRTVQSFYGGNIGGSWRQRPTHILIGQCHLSQTRGRSNDPWTSCCTTPASILAVFQHLRERLFSMEELAEERIGRSASTSCTTAT